MRGWTDLKAYFESIRDETDTRLNFAATQVASTYRTFYVDQANGSDAAAGTLEDPLASMSAVNARSVHGGVTTAVMQGDYEERASIGDFRMSTLQVRLQGNALSFAEEVGPAACGSWRFAQILGGLGYLAIEDGDLLVGNATSAASVPGRTFLRGRGNAVQLYLRNVDLQVAAAPADGTRAPGQLIGQPCSILVGGATFPTAMAGRWVEGVAAGTDPETAREVIFSNLTSL